MSLVLAAELVIATVVSLALVQFILRPASRLLFVQKEQAELDFARSVVQVAVRYVEQAQKFNPNLRDSGNRKARALMGARQWLSRHNSSPTDLELDAMVEEAVNSMQELRVDAVAELPVPPYWAVRPEGEEIVGVS